MSDDARALPPAGFYPDPAGGQGRRWWDGAGWTDRVEQAYTGGPVHQPELTPGTKTGTVWIWIIVLLPLVNLLSFVLFDWRGYLQSSIDDSLNQTVTRNPFSQYLYPGYLAIQALSFVVYAVGVLFAWLDWRALKKLGVVRPFHWAWAFLGSIVYVIGRSVVARRRTHGGLAPLWVYIAVFVLSVVVSVVVVGTAMADVFSSIDFSNLPSSTP